MRTGLRFAAALTFGALATVPSGTLAQAIQRGMYVSVVDSKGVPAQNVGPNDLSIREDNVAREVLRVAPATDPIDIALLVDTSTAARNFIRDYRVGVPAFLDVVLGEESSGQNHVALIGIGERPTILADYTNDRKKLTDGVNRLFAAQDSGTYLLDAIMEVSQGIQKRGAERAVIVAFVSEGPELSNRNYTLVLERLKASGATFHVMTIGSPANFAQDRSLTLSLGTKQSGGRYDTLLVSSALATRAKELAQEIVSQYRVTYARPDSLIPPEKVEVSAKRQGLTARGIAINPPSSKPGASGDSGKNR